MSKNIKIVVIDDDTEMTERPLYFKLEDTYGKENILWFETPEDGLNYVKDNRNQRTVILLDYEFGTKRTNGLEVFQELQQISSLLYIILYTAKSTNIPAEQLKKFINNHLMAMVDKTSDGYKVALIEIANAIKNLNNRVDCILEEWILRHEKFKQETPYIKDETGKSYSLKDVLIEIRKDTEFGRKMSSNIISTAISFLQKDIKP
jgi:DNA-binding NtrC family response regulator